MPDPQLISPLKKPMRAVKLTNEIKYLHCEDEDGAHGVMILHSNDRPIRVADIGDQSDFRFWFTAFAKTAESRKETASV